MKRKLLNLFLFIALCGALLPVCYAEVMKKELVIPQLPYAFMLILLFFLVSLVRHYGGVKK